MNLISNLHAYFHRGFSAIIFSLLFLIPALTNGQNPPDAWILVSNQIIKREIKSGETQRFKVTLKKDEFFQCKIEGNAPRISLSLLNEKTNELIISENPKARPIPPYKLSLSFVAPNDNEYLLEVVAPKTKTFKAFYTLKRNASRTATVEERKEIADLLNKRGQSFFEIAFDLKQLSERNSNLKKAILYYQNGYSIYQSFETRDSIFGRIISTRYIGVSYFNLNDSLNAIKFLELSLNYLTKLEKEYGLDLKVPKTMLFNDLGRAYFSDGREERALFYLRQVDTENFDSWKGNEQTLKESLDLLFDLYVSLGDVEDYDKSIQIFEKLLNYFNSGNSLTPGDHKDFYIMYLHGSLGKAYTEAGYYRDAINSNNKALDISQSIQKKLRNSQRKEDKELVEAAIRSESTSKNNIGIDYLRSGNFDEAKKYIQESLYIAIKQKKLLSIVKWKANLGGVFARQKKYDLALKYFDETLPQLRAFRGEYATKFKISKDINDRLEERNLDAFVGIDLYYYGTILREIGKTQEAIKYHRESVQVLNQVKFRKFESRARVELGLDYIALNKLELAEEEFTKAYQLSKSIKARDEQIVALDGLMRTWTVRDRNLAIIYGKQSVNLLQTARSELEKIGKNFASEFVKDNENTYRSLANLLITDGRLREAQIVLEMLKIEEFKELTTKRGLENNTVEIFDDESKIVINRYEVAELSRRQKELKNKCGELSQNPDCQLLPEEKTELSQIQKRLATLNQEYIKFLEIVQSQNPNLKDRLEKIKEDKLTPFLLAHNAVAIYTVVGNNPEIYNEKGLFGWTILVTANAYLAYPIYTKGLNQNIANLQTCLRNDSYDPKSYARELYNRIFRQKGETSGNILEDDLNILFKGVKEKVIMWSLDGVLRDVPMAVLHNGQHYLVEEYIQTVISAASEARFNASDSSVRRILGFGVTKAKTIDGEYFEELRGSEKELKEIVRQPGENTGIIDGVRKIDDEFKSEDAPILLTTESYSLLHYAVHFKFNEANQQKSYLITGNGKLTLEKLDVPGLFSKVDIATFSACETLSTGRGKETEGLAVQTQKLGAKTVIASLWKVSDIGTPELMIQFYKILKNEHSLNKGEAFRRAQLSLLNGEVRPQNDLVHNSEAPLKSSGSKLTSGGLEIPVPKGLIRFEPFPENQRKFRHPHYWASFVMVGNWR